MQRHRVTSLETARLLANHPSGGGGGGGGSEGELPGNYSVYYLFFFFYGSTGRVWAGLNEGENSLHWKANMLPLFSIMTLWSYDVFYEIKKK